MELIGEDKLKYLAGKHGFNIIYLEKDYFITLLLFFIRDIDKIYFKGGTALNKIFLDNSRLSEDLDFTSRVKIAGVKKEIESLLPRNIFHKLETDHFTKDFIRYHVYFKSYFEKESFVILDINKKSSIRLKPETHKVPNFYGLEFEIKTLNIDELIAEKVRALVMRNQPRDYFDLFFLLKKYKLDMKLVNKKLGEADYSFDKEKIFKNAQKIFSKWDTDLLPLTNRKVEFLEVMKELQTHFRYRK